MKYSKIMGTFLNFQSGQRLSTGISYSSQEIRPAENEIVIRTYENNKVIETHLLLKEPKFLEFSSWSDDPETALTEKDIELRGTGLFDVPVL